MTTPKEYTDLEVNTLLGRLIAKARYEDSLSPRRRPLSPNWEELEATWAKTTADGGISRTEAIRHLVSLRKAISETERDPDKCKRRIAAVSNGGHRKLGYLTPKARLTWVSQIMREYALLRPDGPFFAVTLLRNDWEYNTRSKKPIVALVKDTVTDIIEKIGASAFGHVEEAVFPKILVEDGYLIAAHAQIVVWGVEEKALKRALKPLFPKLKCGTPGYCARLVTKNFCKVVSYSAKAPAYGYSSWPRADGTKKHEILKIPNRGHRHLERLFSTLRWPDFAIATGEGQRILRRAVRELKFDAADHTCPPGDNVKRQSHDEPAFGALTSGGGVNPAISVNKEAPSLQEQIANAVLAFEEYRGEKDQAKSALYNYLGVAYEMALTSAVRKSELMTVARARGISVNASTDLFALWIKNTIPTAQCNRRRASEYAASLRYAHAKGCPIGGIPAFLKEYRGVKKCARGAAPNRASGTGVELSSEDAWEVLRLNGRGFAVGTNQLEMPVEEGILFALANEEKTRLIVRHVIDRRSTVGRQILAKIAKILQSENSENISME